MEKFQLSSSYPLNLEEGYDDDPVEFINEVRVACLICGTDTEIDNIVKQEIDQFEENPANNQDIQLCVGGGSINHDVFYWLLKWFRVDIAKNGKQNKRFIDRGWDGEGGDILRFCTNCKMELKGILGLQMQLDDLEEKVKNGLVEVKGKMERFEEAFEINGVYENDERYKLVRIQILKCENVGDSTQIVNQPLLGKQPVDPSSKRRSSRLKTNTNISTSNTVTPAATNNNDVSIVSVSSQNSGSVDYQIVSNLPKRTLEISSDIRAPAKRSQTKVARNVTHKKDSTNKSAIIVREKSSHLKPAKDQRKQVQGKACNSNNRRKSSRLKLNMIVHKSNINTSAGKDDVRLTMSNVSTLNTANTKHQIIPNIPEVNPDNSSEVLIYAKKSKPKEIVQNEIRVQTSVSPAKKTVLNTNTSQKSIQKAKKTAQEQVKRHTSARIAKIPKTTYVSAMDIDLATSEDDKKDVNKNAKRNGQIRMVCRVDPSTNTITYGVIKFSILSDDTKKVSCTSCKAVIANKKPGLYAHIMKHHSQKFMCLQCPFRGQNKYALEVHTESVHHGHSVWRTFNCKICGKPTTNLKNHEWTHKSKEEQDEIRNNRPEEVPKWINRRLRCEECGKIFASQKEVKLHKKKVHKTKEPEKQKETCPECGKMFAQLKNHMQYYHTNEARFKCIEQGCGKSYPRLSYLTRHKNEKHKGKPWKCTKCSREFARKANFQNHVDLHLGIRPWKCEVERCGEAFVTKLTLKTHHERYHSGGGTPSRKRYTRRPNVFELRTKRRCNKEKKLKKCKKN